MVGLVLVSHSRSLAEAACGLARGVGNAELPIDFAGGAGDDHSELGTDATDIMEAIRRVDSGDGVAVLMDLGSAVLSARMAADLLDGEVSAIRLCPAPLVEGAVAAAIQIGTGASLDAVCLEAKNALAAKIHDMTEEGDEPPPESTPAGSKEDVPADAERLLFTIADPNGMHTRPAAELVRSLSGFNAETRIRNASTSSPFVNARSLNQIALSNIRAGDVSELAVWGADTAQALASVRTLIKGDLHGEEVSNAAVAKPQSAPADTPAEPEGVRSLAPGIVDGILYLQDGTGDAALPQQTVDDPEAEVTRFDAAVSQVREDMAKKKSAYADGKPEAAILEAQILILDDEDILSEVRQAVRTGRRDAASAYQGRMKALADSYRSLTNPYLRERAADVGGVAGAVLAQLSGEAAEDTAHLENVVMYAGEASPAQIGQWRPGQLVGILTTEGGPTSHVAILARSLGIPALMGVVPPSGSASGERVLVDGNRAEVLFKPSPEQVAGFDARRAEWAAEVARDAADSKGSATTKDGVRVPVLANVGDVATASAAARNGAEGIGLLRTEFLFLDRVQAPGEDEQVERLSAIFAAAPDGPITVRTLDAGGDKAMPWLAHPPEANPFLGERGIRLCLRHPDLFRTQLRSVLRAGIGRELEIMAPMVATVAEVTFFLNLLDDCHRELLRESLAHVWRVRRGIMIETPAAVAQAAKFAGMLDFFSIGSNDLTQYILCAERGSRLLQGLSDGMHPAVLSAIRSVCAGAAEGGAAVAVCGEMASDPVSARALLGLGVEHLSVNGAAAGKIKRTIRESDIGRLRELAGKAVGLDSAEEARALFG